MSCCLYLVPRIWASLNELSAVYLKERDIHIKVEEPAEERELGARERALEQGGGTTVLLLWFFVLSLLPYIFISIAWHGNYCLKHDWYKFSIHRKTVKYGVEEETKECYILAQRNVSFLSFLFDDIPNIF